MNSSSFQCAVALNLLIILFFFLNCVTKRKMKHLLRSLLFTFLKAWLADRICCFMFWYGFKNPRYFPVLAISLIHKSLSALFIIIAFCDRNWFGQIRINYYSNFIINTINPYGTNMLLWYRYWEKSANSIATFSQSCLSPLKISGVCINCPTLHNKAEWICPTVFTDFFTVNVSVWQGSLQYQSAQMASLGK